MVRDITRRQFLAATARTGLLAGLSATGCASMVRRPAGIIVNDVHTQLNETRVSAIHQPKTRDDVLRIVNDAARSGRSLAICGGRHAAGGQQFGEGHELIDTRSLAAIHSIDTDAGIVHCGAGIQWPALIDGLLAAQPDDPRPWTIGQKQTGANSLCLGGALSSNIHGRALDRTPIVGDIESFTLVNAKGEAITCSRSQNEQLFRLAIGGYGLFGMITDVRLRLDRRRKLKRRVSVIRAADVAGVVRQRIADGYTYGDFQFAVDRDTPQFLDEGVFACYHEIDDAEPITGDRKNLSLDDWQRLILLAHTDPAEAYRVYQRFYLATDGQVYHSDAAQLSDYLEGYHRAIDVVTGAPLPGSEVIGEHYVPLDELAAFLGDVRDDFRKHQTELIYGTVRMIRQDRETFLPWAKRDYACVIFNLHVTHTPSGIARVAADYRRVIDRALQRDGSFYLTYHRWARRDQIDRAYPRFAQFLRLKRAHDPNELFSSNWYRAMQQLFET